MRLSLLTLLLTSPLFADTNVQFDPNVCVHHSVNATTGYYYETHNDLVVRGVEPIVIHRVHNSVDAESDRLGNFRFHYEDIRTCVGPHRSNHTVTLREASGLVVTFKPAKRTGYHHGAPKQWWAGHFCDPVGYTNTSGGLSGKAHPSNYELVFKRKAGFYFELTLGSGEKRIYKHRGKKDSYLWARYSLNEDFLEEHFVLTDVIRPNGNQLHYLYDGIGRLMRIQATDGTDSQVLSWVDFEFTGPTSWDISKITASDGQVLRYEYETRYSKVMKPHHQDILVRVYKNGELVASYDHDHQRIVKRSLPTGEYLGTDYLLNSERDLRDQKHDLLRVGKQTAPVGPGGTEATIATFDYRHTFDGHGWTTVKDALGNDSRYHFEPYPDHRLNLIEQYDGETLVRNETFTWHYTDLMGHYFTTEDQTAFSARQFGYDNRHNLTQETLLGNLTGTGAGFMQVHPKYSWDQRQNERRRRRIPVGAHEVDNPERYTKTHTYSTDGYNNLLSESYDDVVIQYTYLPNTDLVTRKEIHVDGVVTETDLFEYDSLAQLSRHLHTDGYHTLGKKITACTTTAGYGLPEWIEEYALEEGIEIPIRKTHLLYSPGNQVRTQEFYDAEGMHASTLSFEYDEMGRLLSKTDPLGQKTAYAYDPSGKCIEEATPTTTTTYAYDPAGRPISTTKTDHWGFSITTKTGYDTASNATSQTDPSGNTTTFTYNRDGLPLTKT